MSNNELHEADSKLKKKNVNHPAEDTVSKNAIDDGMVSITAKIPVHVKEALITERDKQDGKSTYGEVIEVWCNSCAMYNKTLEERDDTISKLSAQNSELLQKLKEEDTVWQKKTK